LFTIFIYNLFIRLYFISAQIASKFSDKAEDWVEGRKKAQNRLGNFVTSARGKKIWFHCASLGEFEQVRPLIEKIRQLHPEYKLVLTFFSPSGFNARRYYDGVDFVGYLPVDTEYEAKRYIRKMKPLVVIWVKYDFWYHMLYQLHRKEIPIILVSSIFRPDQVFFKNYGSLHRKMLGMFRHIFVQNDESKQLLGSIGVDSEVSKDTRYDSVYNTSARHKPNETIAAFRGDKKVFIAGSTWDKDADLICRLIDEDPFDGEYKYIIAPHDVSKENVNYIVKKIKKKKAQLSRIKPENANKFDVIIVDTIGLLANMYYYGDIAYVGGGFNASIHNILEPAVFGMPVIFGPHFEKSDEAKVLLSHPEWNAAYTINNYEELASTALSLIANNEKDLLNGKAKSREFVLTNTGATERIYSYLAENQLLTDADQPAMVRQQETASDQ
jgi:3-deoxy-D-manno-octulosonic-acid transferase